MANSFVTEIGDARYFFEEIWENKVEKPNWHTGRKGVRFGQTAKKTVDVTPNDKNAAKVRQDAIVEKIATIQGETPRLTRVYFRLDHSGKVMAMWAFDPDELNTRLRQTATSNDPDALDDMIKRSSDGRVGEYIYTNDTTTSSLLYDENAFNEAYTANTKVVDIDDLESVLDKDLEWEIPPTIEDPPTDPPIIEDPPTDPPIIEDPPTDPPIIEDPPTDPPIIEDPPTDLPVVE